MIAAEPLPQQMPVDVGPEIAAGLASAGLAIVRDFLPPDAIGELRAEGQRRDAAGDLVRAGVGRGAARTQRADVRGDRILWLDEGSLAPPEQRFLAALERLRGTINRAAMLGLWDFEGHYALYPPGAAYARHRDRFRDEQGGGGERVVSCILYLNASWRAEDGGALRIHLDKGLQRDVLPEGGTLVAFLADRYDHEVLPATRPRLALTGWFRRRAVRA